MGIEQLIVERVKGFLKWNPDKFEVLDGKTTVAFALMEPWGWRRGDEWWVTPPVWRSLFEPDIDAVEAARVLKALDLLRVQDDGNLAIMAKVGGRGARVYAVDGKKLAEFRAVAARGFGGFGHSDKLALTDASPPIRAIAGAPDNPADLLQRGVVRGLRMALDVLDMELDPNDRNFQGLLRAKVALTNNLVNVQARVDEGRMRAARTDEMLPVLLESLKIERAKLAKVDFRRTLDGSAPAARSALWDEPPEGDHSA